MNKFYITTAIDYVNDVIHIGHAFQKVIADSLARYYRIKLGGDNVFFLTGTDEYGQKAAKTAEKEGITPKELTDRIAKLDQKQQESLEVSFNRFIRTTDPDHAKVAQEVWKRVDQNDDIYLGEYIGLYCEGCEAYYNEEDLVDGKCPFHPTLEIKQVSEKNYFFRWSKYKDFLIEHIKTHPEFIYPRSRANEMLDFAKNIQDIPISRSNFKWGVPVPNDPNQVMYVWFDALTNYLTGIGFLENKELFNKFWPADIHILGKDNVRWHALLWPAILHSADIDLPKTILVNGFLNLDGQKISKSIGNIIRPTDWAEKFGPEAVRYYLLRYTTLTEDSDISEKKLIQAYNSDLANGLGNLVSRVAKLAEQHKIEITPQQSFLDPTVDQFIVNFSLNEALSYIWIKIAEADRLATEKRPWDLEEKEAKTVIEDLSQRILSIAFNLQPFMPQTAEKILKQFSGQVKTGKPLFPRL